MEQKISIIVPVYNTAEYLEKCIQSILNQTYTNLEIICINDGSTDDSGKILEKFAEQDKRIKLIHKKNEGVAVARNAGLRIATGDWIGFVDSDDYISEDMYEVLMKANISQEADIVSCGYYFVKNGNCYSAINQKIVPTDCVNTKSFLRYIYERDVYKAVGGYLWSRLFSRRLLLDEEQILKVEFPVEFKEGEDIVFLAHVLLDSEQSIYVEKPLYYYRQRDDSAVHDRAKQIVTLNWAKAYLEIINLFKNEGVCQEVIDIIVRMYVYRCGKLMEATLEYGNKDKYFELKEMVAEYIGIYYKENKNHPERKQWLDEILNYKLY